MGRYSIIAVQAHWVGHFSFFLFSLYCNPDLLGSKARPARKANLTAICEPIA
jgi:hypothetical protein